MAVITHQELRCDACLPEHNDSAGRVVVGLNGNNFNLDLCQEHIHVCEEVLTSWIALGSPVKRGRASNAQAGVNSEAAKIREWATSQGIEVNARGRISAGVKEKYAASGAAV